VGGREWSITEEISQESSQSKGWRHCANYDEECSEESCNEESSKEGRNGQSEEKVKK